MRIVHISPFYYPSIGGIETFCREMSIRTARLGHDVHVITFTAAEPNDEDDEGVTVHRLKPLLSWFKARFSPHVRELIEEIHPDIVHIQAPAPMTQEFAIMKGYKYLATYHNDPVLTGRLDYRMSVWLYRRLILPKFYRRVNRIICPSKSFQQMSKFLKPVPEEKKCVIPNGVDVLLFAPPEKPKEYYRSNLGFDADHVGIFVGSMDRWHAYKGIEVLLEALLKLLDVDLQFIFVGDGELRPRYEARARSLVDRKRVMFLGKVDEEKLIECYWAADFFVLPSTRVECFPIVLLEAMACALPVITTDILGPSDIVEENINGFTVRPEIPEEICGAIRKLVTDEHRSERLSFNARKLAVEKYDWIKVVGEYVKEYETLLNAKGL